MNWTFPKVAFIYGIIKFSGLRRFANHIQPQKTIYALSSGVGKAGVAMIRVSGPDTRFAIKQIAKLKKCPEPRKAMLTTFFDPESKEVLDKGILLWFREPFSFTGEDCCEFHIHGGNAVIAAMLNALSKVPCLRHASPGEFAKRAFLNGKLDLTAAEGLADLIHAETEAQRKQAYRQMDGELHRLYSGWRQRIIKATAHVEAFIDFGEDDNIEADVLQAVNKEVELLLEEIDKHLGDNQCGERLRSGVHVVIVGRPNVGKSSLLNYICKKPAAIVSPTAGTTRDIIECAVDLGGYPILVSDTAGLHASQDDVEIEGMRRALARHGLSFCGMKIRYFVRSLSGSDMVGTGSDKIIVSARKADIIVLIMDPSLTEYGKGSMSSTEMLKAELQKLVFSDLLKENPASLEQLSDSSGLHILVVMNKVDLLSEGTINRIWKEASKISCLTGQGLNNFIQRLKDKVESLCLSPSSISPSLTQARHRAHLSKCSYYLRSYLSMTKGGVVEDVALSAHQLQKCAVELGKISGDITTEDILDVIFKDFCIGK